MTWRPLPAEGGRDPRRIGDSLEGITARLGLAPPSLLGAVFADWEALVGPDVAAHATPSTLRQGVLTVVVDHPAWATSLRLLAGDLLARIAAIDGADPARRPVTELVVHVEGAGPRRRRQARP